MTGRLLFAALLGAAMMLAGLGLLVGNGWRQVQDAHITVSLRSGEAVDATVLEEVRGRAMTSAILVALSTGVPPRPQHWTDFSTDPAGAYSFASEDASPRPIVPPTPVPRFVQPVALPFAAGLAVVVGCLFLAAARWRGGQRPAAGPTAS